MTVDAVYFDLDDTLFDYLRYAKSGLDEAGDYLHALTGREYHAELYDIYFEEAITEGTFDTLVERHGFSPELIEELVVAYHGATDPLEPYPETEPVLSDLADDYLLGCITDGRGGHSKLRRLGIREYFDEVLVTPNMGRSKDDPVVFERALSMLSVRPREAVYVGDDPRSDFRAPNGLGMTTVRVRGGRYADIEPADEGAVPDHEISELEGLLDVLATANRANQSLPKER